MEELCQKLPESDPTHPTLQAATKAFSELREEIDGTLLKLMQNPDKWKEFNSRYIHNKMHSFSRHFYLNKHTGELNLQPIDQQSDAPELYTHPLCVIQFVSKVTNKLCIQCRKYSRSQKFIDLTVFWWLEVRTYNWV